MLIKTVADILNHQSDRFDLLLRPSYNPPFLYNAFRRFPLIPFIYFTHQKKRQIQRNHAINQQNNSKKKKKGQKYKLFNKKVDFLLVDSIRIDKFVADFYIPPPIKRDINHISASKFY